VQAFQEWAASRGTLPAGAEAVELWRDRLDIMLQGREDYLDQPDPTRWRSGDVHRLLMDHLVPRQTDGWALAEHAVDTIREFLQFLDDSERLHPGSTRVATLVKELDRAANGFGEAMADSSRYRMAKRVWTAMRADGLSFDSDPAEVDRWAERFSALDARGRRQVLGDLMDQDPGYATGHLLINGGQVVVLRPGAPPDKSLVWPDEEPCERSCCTGAGRVPAALPVDAELAASVAGSEMLRRLAMLAEWVGAQGRPVDRRGELLRKDIVAATVAIGVPDLGARNLRDVPALATLWDLALELDVISLRRTRVIQGDALPVVHAALRGDGAPEPALDMWDEIFGELVHPGSDAVAPEQQRLRDWAQPWTPRLLGRLCTEYPDGEFADVKSLVGEVISERSEAIPPGDTEMFTAFVLALLLRSLSVLAEHGAVEVDAPSLPDELPTDAAAAAMAVGMALWVVSPPDGLRVRLTDLGRRSIYKRLPATAGAPPMASANV
jgi:hypothetical protein